MCFSVPTASSWVREASEVMRKSPAYRTKPPASTQAITRAHRGCLSSTARTKAAPAASVPSTATMKSPNEIGPRLSVIIRAPRSGSAGGGFGEAPEAAVAGVIPGDGGRELGGAEVGPHRVGEVQLGVGAFPQQEVRQALLAAAADQQVDVGKQVAGLDRVARGVVDREAQLEAGAAPRAPFRGGDRVDQRSRETVAPSHDAQADAVRDAARGFRAQMPREETHRRVDLGGGALPVVAGEREQRERADAEVGGRLDGAAHRFGADAVAGGALETAALRPAAVAVEDDRDMQRTLRHKVLPQKKWTPYRVARISASMWSRYRSNARRPAAVRRYSVFGIRPSNDFAQLM